MLKIATYLVKINTSKNAIVKYSSTPCHVFKGAGFLCSRLHLNMFSFPNGLMLDAVNKENVL